MVPKIYNTGRNLKVCQGSFTFLGEYSADISCVGVAGGLKRTREYQKRYILTRLIRIFKTGGYIEFRIKRVFSDEIIPIRYDILAQSENKLALQIRYRGLGEFGLEEID